MAVLVRWADLALTAGFPCLSKIQTQSEILRSFNPNIIFLYLKNQINILTAERKMYRLFYIKYLCGNSAMKIKKCIDQELKSADNPCVLTNFHKLLSSTYYSKNNFPFVCRHILVSMGTWLKKEYKSHTRIIRYCESESHTLIMFYKQHCKWGTSLSFFEIP